MDDAISQPPSVKEVDPFELLDPVDVLPKLSKEFQVNMESKKWTDRRDALQVTFLFLFDSSCRNFLTYS